MLLVRNHYLLSLFICSFLLSCDSSTRNSNSSPIVIEVTGEDFNWHYRYPGFDGILGTSDDKHSVQNLYLPTNASVQLNLKSKDYVYTFALPDKGLKEIAIPDLDFSLQFTTGDEKTIELLGDQFCGFAHKSLIGKAFIGNQNIDFYPKLN